MVKEKALSANPVQAYNKKSKKASINKSRAEKSKLRDDKLQKRRPDQVQRQIDELRQLSQDGRINNHDRALLETLEKDLARIQKLRSDGKVGPQITSENYARQEAQKEKRQSKIPKDPTRSFYYDPIYNPYGVPPPGMEYRERDEQIEVDESDSSTSSSVARIPMPPGTPPPLKQADLEFDLVMSTDRMTGRTDERQPPQMADTGHASDTVTPAVSKIEYASAPVMRNLQQESAVFVPKGIKRKLHTAPTDNVPADPLDPEGNDNTTAQQNPLVTRRSIPQKRRLNLAPDIS